MDGDGIGDACDICASEEDVCSASYPICSDVEDTYQCCDEAGLCICGGGRILLANSLSVEPVEESPNNTITGILDGTKPYYYSRLFYKGEDLDGVVGNLTGIEVSVATAGYFVFSDMEIYVKHSYTYQCYNYSYNRVFPNTASYLKVFDGSLTFNTTGWFPIEFDTPFPYNGSSHVEIMFVNQTGQSGYSWSVPKICSYGIDNSYARFCFDYGAMKSPKPITIGKRIQTII